MLASGRVGARRLALGLFRHAFILNGLIIELRTFSPHPEKEAAPWLARCAPGNLIVVNLPGFCGKTSLGLNPQVRPYRAFRRLPMNDHMPIYVAIMPSRKFLKFCKEKEYQNLPDRG
jgi:hypothetical protein